jgi:hypothetical protein
MSRRFWVIGALAVIAVLIFGWTGLTNYWSYQAEHAYERARATNYPHGTAEDVVRKCLAETEPSFSKGIICLAQAIESAREAQRAQYDLKAQQDMAEWAYGLLWVSIPGLLISAAGLWGLLWSLQQTRTAIKDNRKIGEAQTVAYPSIDSLSFELGERKGDPYRPTIRTRWKNAGNTPAFDFGIRYLLAVSAPGKQPFKNEYAANVERGLSRIDADAPETFESTPDDIGFSQYIEDMEAKTLIIEIKVIGSYRNAFDRIVPIKECFRSSAIYHHPAPGGVDIFEIKMAKYKPS